MGGRQRKAGKIKEAGQVTAEETGNDTSRLVSENASPTSSAPAGHDTREFKDLDALKKEANANKRAYHDTLEETRKALTVGLETTRVFTKRSQLRGHSVRRHDQPVQSIDPDHQGVTLAPRFMNSTEAGEEHYIVGDDPGGTRLTESRHKSTGAPTDKDRVKNDAEHRTQAEAIVKARPRATIELPTATKTRLDSLLRAWKKSTSAITAHHRAEIEAGTVSENGYDDE